MEVSFGSRDVMAAICLIVFVASMIVVAVLGQAADRADRSNPTRPSVGYIIGALTIGLGITAPALISWIWLLHDIVTSSVK